MTRPAQAPPPRARDPYGLRPTGSWIAPGLAVLGLVLVAIVTLNLLQGEIPFGIGGNRGNDGSGDAVTPGETPAPSNVVVVPQEATFKGTVVYAKAGNIWIQTDAGARQITTGGDDSQPSFSPDGSWIYYIRTARDRGKWPAEGTIQAYDLDVPQLMRIRADGSGDPEKLATGKFKKGAYTYAYWIRQPVLSPDGKQVAVVSDAPNPDTSTVVLQFWDPATGKFTKANVGGQGNLGHQDPEWRPDGGALLYVKNGRDGTRGAPAIVRYNPDKGTIKQLTGAGYLQPSYSPDGRYIAATKTSAYGSDVVILDGSTGGELARITNDDRSWSPVWSPAGDGIAFLHLTGQTVDLRLAKLAGAAPGWTVDKTIDLTEVSGLDADSGPDWFIPADQLPATPPPSVPATAPAAAPSATLPSVAP